MAIDNIAVDKRRIQDNDGDVLDITPDGNIVADTWQEQKLSDGEIILASYHLDDLAAGSTCTLGFSTCSIHDIHLVATANTTGSSHVEFREEPTYTGGVSITPLNMNRQKPLPCANTVFVSNPTVTEDGFLLVELHSGSAGWKAQISGSADMESWVVKKDTKYTVKVTNDSDEAIDVTIIVVYHKHEV